MAFRKYTLTVAALVSGMALVAATGCEVTTTDTGGTGGNGASGGSTSDGGMGTGGDATGGMGMGGYDTSTCESYCTANIAACSGANVQWADAADAQASCENFCAQWEDGTPGDMQGNTRECRSYHTTAAESDAATHCPHAGPYGGAVCGTNQCEEFCGQHELLCAGTGNTYASTNDCLVDCGGLADNADPFQPDVDGSDTFACRGYHLTVAAEDTANLEAHCGHAMGDAPCAP